MSNRQSDTRGEKALGLFLDHYFYPKLCEIEGFNTVKRVYDANEQKLGADIHIVLPRGETLVFDEKAQLHYINAPRRTFAFEVSYYNDETGGISDGWLVNNDNKTDYYVLVWIDSARSDQLNRIVEDDFNEITVAAVAKKRIIYYLERLGYPVKRIKKISRDMRFNNNKNYFKLSEDAFLYFTKEGYEEKPINIVIDRRILWTLASGIYKVDRKNCVKL